MKGDLNSLNASASAAILLYEAVRAADATEKFGENTVSKDVEKNRIRHRHLGYAAV